MDDQVQQWSRNVNELCDYAGEAFPEMTELAKKSSMPKRDTLLADTFICLSMAVCVLFVPFTGGASVMSVPLVLCSAGVVAGRILIQKWGENTVAYNLKEKIKELFNQTEHIMEFPSSSGIRTNGWIEEVVKTARKELSSNSVMSAAFSPHAADALKKLLEAKGGPQTYFNPQGTTPNTTKTTNTYFEVLGILTAIFCILDNAKDYTNNKRIEDGITLSDFVKSLEVSLERLRRIPRVN